MHPQPRPAGAGTVSELLNPEYWLVFGLVWPGDGGMAEAAVAFAPGMIPREVLSHDAYQVLGCADLYARKHAQRVVFFSDLTRILTAAGTSWALFGVDWESALRELQDGPFPAMYLAISERAHLLICDPVANLLAAGPGGAAGEAGAERDLVRQAITSQLTTDWPPWMNAMIDAGRVRLAG
jgi:hypothetical protein